MSDGHDRTVLDVIRDIQGDKLDPRHLPAPDRQACVTHLSAEGFSLSEIAQILKRSERTIARDRQAIQEANALKQDPSFAGEMAGILVSEADACISRMRRATRPADTPAAVRVEAERASFVIRSELCQRLQSLGFLPTAAHRVEAHLTHGHAEPPSFDELQNELQRLHELEGSDPRVERELADLSDRFHRARLADGLSQLEAPQDEEPSDDSV